MPDPLEDPETRKRIAAIAAVFLIGSAIGIGLAMRVAKGRAPGRGPAPKSVFSQAGPMSLTRLSGRALEALLRSPRGAALSRRLTEELMRDPAMRARWEQLSAEGGKSRAKLLALMKGTPGFDALLANLEREPAVQAELADGAPLAAGALRDPRPGAPGSGDRIMVKAGKAPAPERPSPPSGGGNVRREPGKAAFSPRRVRQDAGRGAASLASLLLGRLKPQERATLMQSVENGYPIVKACAETGLSEQCVTAHDDCLKDSECAPRLAVATAFTRDAVFAIRKDTKAEKPPPAKVLPTPDAPPPPDAGGAGDGGGGGEPPPPSPPHPPGEPPPSNPNPPPSPNPSSPPPPEAPEGPPPPPGQPPTPPPEPPPEEPPPPSCMPYGALCAIYDDCHTDWNFDDCGTCCSGTKWNWTSCTYEDPYGYGWSNQYGSHGWATCK